MIATSSQKYYGPYPKGYRLNRSSRRHSRFDRRLRRPFELESLEPRLLLDADTKLSTVSGATPA